MIALLKLLRTTTFRWLLGYVLVFAVIASAVMGYLFWHANNLLTGQLSETIAAEVQGLREQYVSGGSELLIRTVAERSSAPGNSLYLLVTPGGERLAGNLSQMPAELAAANGGGGSFRYVRGKHATSTQRLAIGVLISVPGGARLVVGRDIEDQRDFATRMRHAFLIGLSLVLACGLAGGIIAGRQIIGRIDKATETSRTIMAGNLSERLPVSGSGDELDRLARNLNAMLARIEQLMNGLREVSDNIAHDLKTPLTRLRNQAEEALRGDDGAGYREALEHTIEGADELIRTFNALLSIARLEAGAGADGFASLSLNDLVSDVGELYQPAAEEAGFELHVELPEHPVAFIGDRQLLGQAVANLIENALKYGAPVAGAAASIVISLSCRQQMASIGVADHGTGIPEADWGRVLRRFVRLEESRSRPGTGLGLSLVAAVVHLHGGELELGDNRPGLRVSMVLPLLAATGGATGAPTGLPNGAPTGLARTELGSDNRSTERTG